jgi:hypothetical protein
VGVLLSPRGATTYPSANDMSLATNLNLTIMLTNPEAPHEYAGLSSDSAKPFAPQSK